MYGKILAALVGLALASCATSEAQETPQPVATTMDEWAQGCEPWDDWDKPAPPFKIHGNTYYVGTCGITSIVIASADSHALIDTGTEAGADVVLSNLPKIGIDPADISVLLSSHEHFDHVGGMAKMQSTSNADVISSRIGIDVMASGQLHRDDPQFGMHEPMKPISFGMPYDWGNAPQLIDYFGLSPIVTPGHTPGALSWQWKSCEGDECFSIVYADSLSPVSRDDYRFSDHPAYVAEYRAGLQRLREVKCDILLTPHPSASKMLKRAETGSLIGGMSCVEYADSIEERLSKRLLDETTEVASD